MHKLSTLLIINILLASGLSGQKMTIAELQEDGSITTTSMELTESQVYNRSTLSQLPNFPFMAASHPNFKNFRNVTIADLDDDGKNEIVVCMDQTLYAINSDGGVHWEYQLAGTANFPPAIADIDGDGDLEVAVQTYGIPSVGNVYLFDHNGALQEGWPINMDDNYFFNAITLADLDGQLPLEIIACERISSSSGQVHALKTDGTSLNSNWPIAIPGTPAFTPTVADINQDGNKNLITSTTTALYVFDANGEILSSFPIEEAGTKFSYQSPLVADLNADGKLEIIGARHGDFPGTIVLDHNGDYFENWPDYDDIWTFATPTVVDIDGDSDYEIFFSRPYFSETTAGPILLAYDHMGKELDGFPILGTAGAEGLVSVADIDGDGDYELLTSSKASSAGRGYIHAYHFETQEEVANFPLRVEGSSLLSGAYLSDINNDGKLDLTALSYQLKFDPSNPDSTFINVFDLEVPYDESTILFNGYKGSNSHDGLVESQVSSLNKVPELHAFSFSPNPARESIFVDQKLSGEPFKIFNLEGKLLSEGVIKDSSIGIGELKMGAYLLKIANKTEKFIKF